MKKCSLVLVKEHGNGLGEQTWACLTCKKEVLVQQWVLLEDAFDCKPQLEFNFYGK